MKTVTALLALLLFYSPATASYVDSLKKEAGVLSGKQKAVPLEELADYYSERLPDSSVFYSIQLIELGKKIKDIRVEAIGENALAFAVYNKGNYPKSLELLLSCLRKFEDLDDKPFIADTYNQIGNVNKSQNKLRPAIEYYTNCRDLAESIKDSTNVLYACMNVSFAYFKLGLIDSALLNAQNAYVISMKMGGEDNQQDYILMTLGNIYAKLGSRDIALAYYKQALTISTKLKQNKRIAMGYNEIAFFYKEEGRVDSSLYYAKLGLKHATMSSHLLTIYESSSFLSAAYEEQHNVDSAFRYQKISMAAKDSLFSAEKAQQLENMHFNEQLHQQELQMQQMEIEAARRDNIQYAAIALGMIVLVVTFLLFSHSIVATQKHIKFLGVISLLVVFEFINLLIHPFLGKITHHSPLWMLLIMVAIAALLVPLHHKLEHWITHKLVEKNKRVRLAAAQKILAELKDNEEKKMVKY